MSFQYHASALPNKAYPSFILQKNVPLFDFFIVITGVQIL